MSDPTSSSRSLIWRGALTSPGRLARAGGALISPGLLWIVFFCALPTLLLCCVAFASRSDGGGIEWTFTLDNFKQIAGYGTFGWTSTNLVILGRSLAIAAVTTVLCTLLAYPLAFFIASRPRHTRMIWLVVLTVPFWTNLIVRTYAWLIVLGPDSPITHLATFLGFIEPGQALYPGTFATCMGMITAFLPFMVMPLYAAVDKLDWNLLEAAQDLYSSRLRVFRHAIFPQTSAALFVGIVLTFIPAMGMFLVSDILGGAKFMLIGNLIQLQFGFGSGNPPYAAALSLVLILLTLLIVAGFARLGGKREDIL